MDFALWTKQTKLMEIVQNERAAGRKHPAARMVNLRF